VDQDEGDEEEGEAELGEDEEEGEADQEEDESMADESGAAGDAGFNIEGPENEGGGGGWSR
jgi:hypothetical protein